MSDQQQQQQDRFATGAVRDNQENKPRYDLIPVDALYRLAMHYTNGAKKYGEGNWQKGIPFLRCYASLLRHVFAWAQGEKSEDHLAAIAWNAFALMHYEEAIKRGELPASLDDMGVLCPPEAIQAAERVEKESQAS